MKLNQLRESRVIAPRNPVMMLAGALLLSFAVHAFPPAPHHAFQGMLRDEYGRPITSDDVKIFFETPNGGVIGTEAGGVFKPGVNYKIKVPMDSGVTPELYKPFAMKVQMPYKIQVKIGFRTYLPIEMLGSLKTIGQPGGITRMDLTLGEDTDGDGMPDAWERALLGNGRTLSDINPNDDTDGDGLSNLQEYISGNYAFDKEDGFRLDILETTGVGVRLEFLAITGRTYVVHQSNDLREWKQVGFNTRDGQEKPQGSFLAGKVTKVNLMVPAGESSGNAKFFKLMVQ
jgi:hypothetical protein